MRIRPVRDFMVAFAVTKAEKERLIELARQADLSLSDYCRKRLFADVREDSERTENA